MTKRIAITGINGFVGKHLTHELFENDIEVIGVGRDKNPDKSLSGLLRAYYSADLTNTWPIIGEVDAIIHLAGLAAVGPSFDNPQEYISANSAMVTSIGEYYLTTENRPRIVVVSSGAVYDSFQPMPITEDSQLGFNSPYAVSKVLNEDQAAYYRNRGLDMIVARPFNHIGPHQSQGFLIPDLIEQLKVAKKDHKALRVGNLKTKRDYTDVRDVARAYRLLATAEVLRYSTYNVCSGESRSGEEILELLQSITSTKDVEIIVDQSKIRPNDPLDIFGSAIRLKQDTDWVPGITLSDTLKDIS